MERVRRQNQHTEDFSHDEAEAIWSEAAKLQSQAQHRLEERSKTISERFDDKEHLLEGFSGDEVRSIAEEAGISAEFVDLAVIRSKSGNLIKKDNSKSFYEKTVRLDEIEATESIIVDLPLERVYEAMRRILPSPKYGLELSDIIGDGNPGDTVLGFKIPSVMNPAGAVHNFAYQMSYVGVKQVYASIHALSGNKCEITIRGDVNNSSNAAIYFWGSVGFSAFLGFIAAAIGMKKFGLDFLTQALPLFTLITVFFSAISFKASRSSHKWGGGKTKKALKELLQAIKVDAITDGSFSAPVSNPEVPKKQF